MTAFHRIRSLGENPRSSKGDQGNGRKGDRSAGSEDPAAWLGLEGAENVERCRMERLWIVEWGLDRGGSLPDCRGSENGCALTRLGGPDAD